MDIVKLYEEVAGYVENLDVEGDGEHLWTKYEEVEGILVRLTQIRNEIAYLELLGTASPQARKFRTTILEPTIDRLDKVAAYESRKITARNVEANLSR